MCWSLHWLPIYRQIKCKGQWSTIDCMVLLPSRSWSLRIYMSYRFLWSFSRSFIGTSELDDNIVRTEPVRNHINQKHRPNTLEQSPNENQRNRLSLSLSLSLFCPRGLTFLWWGCYGLCLT